MSETASAGWYHDPHNSAILRYWDGAAWTEARMPVPAQGGGGDRVSDGVGLLLIVVLGLCVLAIIWYAAVYLD
jgi:hypothetical protein